MRGDFQQSAPGLAQAVAVLDLALGGVQAEMGEVPFGWFSAPVVSVKVAPAVVQNPHNSLSENHLVQAKPVAALMAAASVLSPPVALRAAPVVADVPGEVWVDGEAGGVVLVVQGGKPDGRSVLLARAMLAAAGLQDAVLGWVGYNGKIEAKTLMEAMRGHSPQQVLVLGQGPLGVLLARNLGVEGWHAAGNVTINDWDGAPVGVTYPLDLLLKQPLFKRLAWQHLRAWGEAKILTNNVIEQGE